MDGEAGGNGSGEAAGGEAFDFVVLIIRRWRRFRTERRLNKDIFVSEKNNDFGCFCAFGSI